MCVSDDVWKDIHKKSHFIHGNYKSMNRKCIILKDIRYFVSLLCYFCCC